MLAPIFSCCLPEIVDHFLSLNLWLVNEARPMGSWEHAWEPWKHGRIGVLRPPECRRLRTRMPTVSGMQQGLGLGLVCSSDGGSCGSNGCESQGCGSRNKKKLSGDSTGSSTERSAYLFPADLAPASLARILTFSSNQP